MESEFGQTPKKLTGNVTRTSLNSPNASTGSWAGSMNVLASLVGVVSSSSASSTVAGLGITLDFVGVYGVEESGSRRDLTGLWGTKDC